jgi:hypothetical protein
LTRFPRTRRPAEVVNGFADQLVLGGSRVNGVSGDGRAEAKDEQAAENLRDIVRGFVALAKMQTSNKPGIQKMLPDVQLSGDGKEVAISFAVTNEMPDASRRRGHRSKLTAVRNSRRGLAGEKGGPGRPLRRTGPSRVRRRDGLNAPNARAERALTTARVPSTLLAYPRFLRSVGDLADRHGAHGSDDGPAWRLVRT